MENRKIRNKQDSNFLLKAINVFLITSLIYSSQNSKAAESIKIGHLLNVIESLRLHGFDLTKKVIPISESAGYSKTSIDLTELIELFVPDQSFDYNLYDWKTEANNSAINWLTHGIKMGEHEFYREGETVVSVNGKVIQCLDKNTYPCKWGIVLSGVRNGYTSFEISSVQSQELEKMEITELFKGKKFEAKLLKTDEFDNKTYRVKFPQKKPIDMSVQWSCGSAGCSLAIKCETLDL